MSNQFNRRFFLKTGILLGAGALLKNSKSDLLANTLERLSPAKATISIVKGTDYFTNTITAVEQLGGISSFVKKGDVVGLLVNSRYNKPGTFVKPDIAIATAKMCLDLGVKKIVSLENVQPGYWKQSSISKNYTSVTDEIEPASNEYIKVKIPKAVALKEAEVQKDLLDCNVFINIPIFKQHEGIKVTGCLKNLMGLTSSDTNHFFHFGNNGSDWYSDVDFLAQCIADINLVKKPTLCIADATEYITTNGPFGPGTVKRAFKITAGTDPVLIDAWGADLLGHKPEDILAIRYASKLGLGEMDLSKAIYKESGK